MTKRGYGSGSLRERRPGVWEVRAGRRSKTVHGGRKVAERELSRLVALAGVSRAADTSRTFGELIDARLSIATLSARTRVAYDCALEHLPPAWRERKTHTLTVSDFDRLYADLHRKGVGAPTIRKLHAVLSSACAEGLRWRWLEHHPVRGARLPKAAKHTVSIPSQQDVRKLLDLAAPEPQFATGLRLALATGARRSELLALRWSDVDLPGATITITHALDLDGRLKATKTDRMRVVRLDDTTIDSLIDWRAMQADIAAAASKSVKRDGYVFSHHPTAAEPWRGEDVSRRFKRLTIAADVGHVRVHDLRHMHASYLIALGLDPKKVSERLGHSDVSTTLRIYTHLIDGVDSEAANLIGGLLDR